jgi:chemotaxis protein methyltransferase CheR
MRDSEFEFIRSLVYERSRITLDHSKRELVAARVGRRLREHNLASVTDYCQMLRDPEHDEERARLIDAISTNHTAFFREIAHFDFIIRRIAPEVRARGRPRPGAQYRAWSAACSSGEEAYSIAMTLAAHLADTAWNWRVEATDISRPMLEIAAAAIYPQGAVRPVTPPWAQRYFLRGVGPQTGNWRVRPSIRDGVCFRQLNLLAGPPPFAEPFDLIFCRNVMIYFDAPTQEQLLLELAEKLVPGGYLMIGHSESLPKLKRALERIQPSVYRRRLAA